VGFYLGLPVDAHAATILAVSVGLVGAVSARIYIRSVVDPDYVFSLAMRKLNSHAGLLEVMGQPVAGEPGPEA
jgi:hypothetical protein